MAHHDEVTDLMAQNGRLRSALQELMGVSTRAAGISEDYFSRVYGNAEDAIGRTEADPARDPCYWPENIR